MKYRIKHIILTILAAILVVVSTAQVKTRYVELGSWHALSIPENPDYKFKWEITYGVNGEVIVTSDSAQTHNIRWTQPTTYHVKVVPILDSVGCYGEYVYLDVITVEYLSLHTFDDVYFTDINVPVSGDVSVNDFDDTDADIYYTPTPVFAPEHGSVELYPDGSFTYTPDNGFVGVDEFVYEAYNSNDNPMYSNSKVTIVVQDDTQQADIFIEKTGPEKALLGGEIEYNIMVSNNGSDVATNVVIRDTLAFGLFTPEYAIGSDPLKPWNDSIMIESLAVGDTVTIYLRADISPFAPNMVYNQAITWSDIYDPQQLNNDSIWPTELSAIYVDFPGQLYVPSCESVELPGDQSNSNNEIVSYEWSPATGLSATDVANPLFTPDETTFGTTIEYILKVIDNKGNEATDTMKVFVSEEPVALIEADTLYMDKGVDLVIRGGASTGVNLSYWWDTDTGNFADIRNRDSVIVSDIGTYYLTVSDHIIGAGVSCEDIDSVVVLLKSYPPVAQSDSIAVLAGTSVVLPQFGLPYLALADTPDEQVAYFEALPDSNVNVLLNDYDRNDFNLEITGVVTPPSSGLINYSWDADGQFIVTPDASFWGIDSLEYQVCNDGAPVQCNTSWLKIRSLRPPLNADVEIVKSGGNHLRGETNIAFWDDTIRYNLVVTNLGPDTTSLLTVHDYIASDFHNPQYSIDRGQTWNKWFDKFELEENFVPGDTISIDIKAFIRSVADRFVNNTAYIETDIVDNDTSNDTSTVVSKIKELVEAIAGNDTILGSCIDEVGLDGSNSTGENITYTWTPVGHSPGYLTSVNTATPVFVNPGTSGDYPYVLTVTDDDNITASDTIIITVLEAPVARAGRDYYEIELGDTIGIDGSTSSGTGLTFQWSTDDGYILPGTQNSTVTVINSTGNYKLVVTDVEGCKDSVMVPVYQFFYPPVAIPDYYSTSRMTPIQGNLLHNDFDPNEKYFGEIFNLSVVPATISLGTGAQVVIKADGSFTFSPGRINNGNIINFTYTVKNDAEISKSDRGYVRITINESNSTENLHIVKEVMHDEVVIGERDAVEFRLTVSNKGNAPVNNVQLTDSLSSYLYNARYEVLDGMTGDHNGVINMGDFDAGQTKTATIYATARPGSPSNILNAAMTASETFDHKFDWDDVDNRNVDTASVRVVSDLIARARLVERFDPTDDRNDFSIGYCDNISYLTAEDSWGSQEIDSYEWSPREMLNYPDSMISTFSHALHDTTINFTLRVSSGEDIALHYLTVHFSPKVIANAGPDRKMNEGETLVIDDAVAIGADAEITWIKNGIIKLTNFEDGDILRPIITETGVYTLVVTDKHGCSEEDKVLVKENSLYLVDDIINVIAGDTIVGNVSINDFDPDGDSIFYTGFADGPAAQYLLEDPMNSGILKSINVDNVIGEDGSFVFIAPDDYTGYTYFTYEGCDDNNPNLCKEATVHVNIIDIGDENTPPVLNPDIVFANIGDTISINVLANDFDPDGGTLTMTSIEQEPSQGELEWTADGQIVYVPYLTATGTDRFVYQACDNGQPSACKTTWVIINFHKLPSENHRPVAVDDVYYVVGKPIEGNILDNDYDPDGDNIALIMDAVEGPYHGDFQLNRDGSFTYVPDEGYEGTDQIVYQILETDTEEELGDFATVYIVSIDESRYRTDVSIVKTNTGDDELISGSTIEYELLVKAEGPTLANDVVFIDTLAAELTDVNFSTDGGVSWNEWNEMFTIDRLMLYEESSILIRARIPEIYAGDLINTAYVDHNMNETKPENNVSEVVTGVYQRVIAYAGEDTIIGACERETFMLEAIGSLGMGELQYQWSPAEYVTDPTAAKTGLIMEPLDDIEFELIVSGAAGTVSHKDTAYVTVFVDREPLAEAGEDTWPEDNNPVILDGESSIGAGGELSYSWWIYSETGEMEEISAERTVDVNLTNDYYLTVTDKYGCTSTDMVHVGYPVENFRAVDDYVVTLQQEPVDIYILDNDEIDSYDEYNLDLLFIIQPPAHGRLVINPQDSSITYIPDDYYFGPDTFIYQISTKFFTDEATVFVNVVQKPPIISEGFSPNGDGINDFMLIGNIELYPENSLIVFNRWGNIVYQAEPYTNDEPWDGVANKGVRIGSGPLPTGVYLYILNLGDDERLEQRIYKGNIYIASDNRR
ncbi:MAG: Ig-like domain-containing protein [Prolixibacteraceae bacterium]|jgi:gliding motility-associated-like protein/uncharacterized repeat protein (TIGR01451 family)|nr:Ig-like domain-containing protein [Prolixibacteraceae bacterium]